MSARKHGTELRSVGGSAQNADRFRRLRGSLVLALLAVCSADLAVRVLEERLSGDVANKRRFSEVMRERVEQQRPYVVAVGSSLVDRGLDTAVMAQGLSSGTELVGISKLAPDNSTIWDWTCVLEQHVLAHERKPEFVVIGFAWDQLSDQAPMILRRNFNHLCPITKLNDYSKYANSVSIETWLKAMMISVSKLYAHQEPIRQRLLRWLIPDYESVSQEMNERENTRVNAMPASPGRAVAQHDYEAATAILRRLAEEGTRAVLVAMPVQEPYALDPAICALAASSGHQLLDLRNAVPSDPALYRDAIHLNSAGAQTLSAALTAALNTSRSPLAPCPA